ncbi:hypothetical protein F5Y19DRAFT_411768 [Xylariaceae sp. FL1651]|nr:hypothetical protein F5Y19DRAFT_411768 [Xylariaceae sp. FL1651]
MGSSLPRGPARSEDVNRSSPDKQMLTHLTTNQINLGIIHQNGFPRKPEEHPSPAQAYELAVNYATLLRHLFTHPQYGAQPPPGLKHTTEFVQNTHEKFVMPFLPKDSSKKCKELANPWAYADPNHKWEWTWDTEAGAMKDMNGKVVEFPRLPKSKLHERCSDILTRGLMAKTLILDNETDFKARILLGGQTFDFGEGARAAARKLD